MFIDKVKIFLKAGDGGNGCLSFRHEKYIPDGGPDGGDGGRGGDIVLTVDEGMSTLLDFRYRQHYKAERGKHGQGKGWNGEGAASINLRVPPGTIVKDADTEKVLFDLTTPGEVVVIAKGGLGGRGNARFVNSVNRAPRIAEKGEPGEEKCLVLELKLIADVGIVGYPNAGKSTFLSRVSAAKPKIADYPFTTLRPNLGVVNVGDGRSFVLADIPGIIEGAHEGIGLGFEFLRHVERTRVLLHIVDAASVDGRDPLTDYEKINEEIAKFSPELATKPQIIALNKTDLCDEETMQGIIALFQEKGIEVYQLSAAVGSGLKEIIYKLADMLDAIPRDFSAFDKEETTVFEKRKDAFEITQDEEGVFNVGGTVIERLAVMTDFENDYAEYRFQNIIEKMGIVKALRKAGAKTGNNVRIKTYEFTFVEDDDIGQYEE